MHDVLILMREHGAMTGLTYDLDVYVSAVRHVLDLNGQRVLPGVGSLCGADEEDGVPIAGASSHRFVIQGHAIFEPGHHGARLTLQSCMRGNQDKVLKRKKGK